MSPITRSNRVCETRAFFPAISLACALVISDSPAATIDKADNADALNLTSSWTGGVIPGAFDTAQWTGLAGANATQLGGDLSFQGLLIGSTGGSVTVQNGNTLTLGTAGIAMGAATQDLTISSNLTLAAGAQAWNVAAGRTLSLNTGTFTRTAGATLSVSGAGTVSVGMTGIANDASEGGGILGPWVTTGTGSATTYAQLVAGNISPYTAGTSGAANVIASGSTAATNYTITTAAAATYGLNRTLNTLRNTVGASSITMGNSTGQINLTVNGILNSGTDTLTIAQGGSNAASGVMVGANNGRELVLNAANAQIAVTGRIINNTGGASSVTVTGPNTVTFGGTSTFTGDLTVNGTLAAGTGQGTAPTASNLGALQPAANRNIIVNNGGTLSLTGGNVLGTGASTNTLANTTLVVNSGGLFRSGLDGAAAGWWNKIGATTLNGGTIRLGSGANNTNFQALALIGTVTVTGSRAASIENFAASNTTTNAVHLGQNAAADQSIIFDVADVTGSSATDLNVSTKLINTSANLVASGLTKTGAGTMTLSATNGYTGATIISAGTLQIGDGTNDGNISTTSSVTNNGSLVYNLVGSQTYANPVTGSGSITLIGGGSLTLSNATNAAGNTTLTAGALKLNGTFGSISVADSTANLLGISAGGKISASSLSFAGDAVVSLPITVAPGSPALITLVGALSTTPANGKVTINTSSAPLLNGTYDLISAGSFTGNLSDFELQMSSGTNSRQAASLILTGSTIALNVAGDSPKWTGAVNGNWTTNAIADPKNWKLITAATGTDFITLDNVLFDDTATGVTALELSDGDIAAGIISFNNSVKNYSISSPLGYLITQGSLSKSGSGALTLSSGNSFSDPITFTGGVLNLGNSGALGSAPLNIESGIAKSLDNTTGIALALTGNNPQNWNDNFTFVGTSDLDMGNGTVTLGGTGLTRSVNVTTGSLTVGKTVSTTQGLTKLGAGTLIVGSVGVGAASSVLGGPLDVAAGTVQINRTGVDTANSGDFTTTGISGNGTIANGAVAERWLMVNTAADQIFTGTLTNGGTGGLGLDKQGAASLTLNGSLSYTGQTTVDGGSLTISSANSAAGTFAQVNNGKLVINHPQALGTAATIRLAGNNVAQLDLAVDGGLNAYGFQFGTTTNSTIFSNRATPGDGVNHTLTTLGANGVGGGTLNVAAGDKVIGGAARLTFTTLGLSAGSVQTTVVAPSTASVTIGDVSKVANTPAQTLELGGTSVDNFVTGTIANGTATVSLVKSGASTWTISGANNTYTGNTNIGTANGAGVLRVTASGALGTGSIIFDGSGGAPGPTSRLELSGGITLANAITLSQRNNASANILNTSGGNVLTGVINLNAGGTQATLQVDAGSLTITGPVTAGAITPRTLVLAGAGNGEISGSLSNNATNAAGVLNLTKVGTGIWNLTAANTNTGAINVNGGTLYLSGDSPAATGPVTVAASATLAGNGDLGGTIVVQANGRLQLAVAALSANQVTRDIAGALDLSAVGDILALTAATTPANGQYTLVTAGGGITGHTAGVLDDTVIELTGVTGTVSVVGNSLILTVGTGPSAYAAWLTSFGLDSATTGLPTADPDSDGFNNATEFLLGGSPIAGQSVPQIHALIADTTADADALPELVLTIAVPVNAPAFSPGSPTSTATFESFIATVRGTTTDLSTFGATVTPVTPITTGLAAAPVLGGVTYEYRSFSLGGSNETTGKGFLQVTVTTP